MYKFLVIQTAFLGDVILATPLLEALKTLYPTAQVDILVNKGNEGVLANNPYLNQVFTFHKKQKKWTEIIRLVKLIRKENYDEVINLQRFGSSGLLTFLSGAKKKIGFDKNPFSFAYNKKITHKIGDNTHEIERNLSLLEDHLISKPTRPSLFPSKEDFRFIRSFIKKPYFVFAPASVWFTKQLPIAKWIELGQKLRSKGSIYIVGAGSDYTYCSTIIHGIGLPTTNNLAGKLSLLQTAALMKEAARCFVNDSAPLHIASAMNSPTTAFFCSTIPAFGYGPLSDDCKIAQTTLPLSCRPCGLHGKKSCPLGTFACGDISITDAIL